MLTFAEAIAELPCFGLVYGEADRQFKMLEASSTAVPVLSLQAYYRDLFERSTIELSIADRIRLVTVCAAYKTTATVVKYLVALDGDQFPWAPVLLDIVIRNGRDKAGIAGQKHDKPYFIVPTIPIAFPSTCLEVWMFKAPIYHLTLANLLAHPCTLQIRLGKDLESVVKDTVGINFGEGHQKLFVHLMNDKERLVGFQGQNVYYEGESIENAEIEEEMRKKKPRPEKIKRGGYGRREIEELLEVYRIGREEREKEKERLAQRKRKRDDKEVESCTEEDWQRTSKKRKSVGFATVIKEVREFRRLQPPRAPIPRSELQGTISDVDKDQNTEQEIVVPLPPNPTSKKRARFADEDTENNTQKRTKLNEASDKRREKQLGRRRRLVSARQIRLESRER